MRAEQSIFITETEPGPGIRLAVKDLFDTAGVRTTYGSTVFADHVPERTADAVALLEAAGYASVGKTNLHEFAYGITSQNPHYGTVPNPAAPGRTSGGSSGGSAAALAAGLADAALGTDTGGSIRIPSACCATVGLKPSYGLVPIGGVFPLAPSFDHAGPMSRDVAGCIELMRHLAPDIDVPEIGLEDVSAAAAWVDEADPLVRTRVEEAVALFFGARPVTFPKATDVTPVFWREVADVHRELFAENAELYGDNVRVKVERCLDVTDAEFAAAGVARERYRDGALAALGAADVLLTPTLAFVPPAAGVDEIDVREGMVQFTFPFNALGWPALALPCGVAEQGLPASIQIVGRPGADGLVLGVARALEAALASAAS